MNDATEQRQLSAEDLRALLAVTRGLAAPFDLMTMLAEVVDAAKQVLKAERGSIWLHDAATDELVLEVASGLAPVRVPVGTGLAGTCARHRAIINVPDCYADPRFDASIDRASGFRTRCMLTLPLVDHRDELVGVMQVLNKAGGAFDAQDEALATALAAQCAVALQRVRMTAALIEHERLRQEVETARVVQMSTLPAKMPSVRGYDVHGTFEPASETGGDTFDLTQFDQGLLVVLADATGHGIAPALSVTNMQAMLRIAFRLGCDLETAFRHVNNQLAATLPEDRFITAFVGLLDPESHRLRFLSGGQGPILHYRAATGSFDSHRPTGFPLGAMPITSLKPAVTIEFAPGDVLVLLSDGIYEYEDAGGAQFGTARVEEVVRSGSGRPMAELTAALLHAVRAFAQGAPQQDDITVVLVRREAPAVLARAFARSYDSLHAIFEFTADGFARLGIDAALLPTVDFAVEELFTNMVKYSTMSTADIDVELKRVDDGVEVTLTDHDVEPFDVTRAPDADVGAPVEQRRPGGLGLHLIRRLTDAIEYEYTEASRQSRIMFRKTGTKAAAPATAADPGEDDARN
jgi:phosphoserine phosphatase